MKGKDSSKEGKKVRMEERHLEKGRGEETGKTKKEVRKAGRKTGRMKERGI